MGTANEQYPKNFKCARLQRWIKDRQFVVFLRKIIEVEIYSKNNDKTLWYH